MAVPRWAPDAHLVWQLQQHPVLGKGRCSADWLPVLSGNSGRFCFDPKPWAHFSEWLWQCVSQEKYYYNNYSIHTVQNLVQRDWFERIHAHTYTQALYTQAYTHRRYTHRHYTHRHYTHMSGVKNMAGLLFRKKKCVEVRVKMRLELRSPESDSVREEGEGHSM